MRAREIEESLLLQTSGESDRILQYDFAGIVVELALEWARI